MVTIQSVINSVQNVTEKISKKFLLNVRFLLLTSAKKNYSSIARANGISYNNVYITNEESIEYGEYAKNFLISLINKLSTKENPGYLIIDFTFVKKTYSEKIPEVTHDYDSSCKSVQKGLSIGFAVWSNGKISIPCDFLIWQRKKNLGGNYQKKTELAKQLILSLQKAIFFVEVKLDGAFASEDMIKFFTQNKIDFTMRVPCNRVITSNKISSQLRYHPALRLIRNEKYKTIQASYKGFSCYFTTHKRKGKKGNHQVVFIISSIKRATAKEHVKAYENRWPVEKLNRSSKQYLGLNDAQSTSKNKQHAHIYMVMFSYAILQAMKIDKKKQSVEEVLRPIRNQKTTYELHRYLNLEQTIMN